VLSTARQITRDHRWGIMEIFRERRKNSDMRKPMMNLKNVISMAGIEELFVMNLAKTVAVAKQNSAKSRKITPLYILDRKIQRNSFFRKMMESSTEMTFNP
jgi:hypothetical protein